jgi:ATP-dependent Clp protease ATP-binding subunit ClpC
MRKKVTDELERMFRPEFRNRLDGIIIFRALTKKEIGEIVELLVVQVEDRLKEYDIDLVISSEAKALLAEEGYDPDFGARPLRRVIQRRIEDTLSEGILAGEFGHGDTIRAEAKDGEIVFEVVESSQETVPPMPEVV